MKELRWWDRLNEMFEQLASVDIHNQQDLQERMELIRREQEKRKRGTDANTAPGIEPRSR